MRRATAGPIALLLLLLPLSAAGSDLVVANPWVSLPILDEDPPLYLVVQNRGSEPRVLVGATSPRCERVEIHRAVVEDGAMTSQKLDGMEIPAGGAVAFAPRGLFLVLIGAEKLAEGETVPLELELSDGEKVALEAVVRDE